MVLKTPRLVLFDANLTQFWSNSDFLVINAQHNERQEGEGHAEVNQAMNQSPRQAMNQSTRQAMNQSTRQAANQRGERDRVQIFSISQRIRHAVDAIRKVISE